METGGSMPHSQELANNPYPEQNYLVLRVEIYFFKIYSNISLGFPGSIFPLNLTCSHYESTPLFSHSGYIPSHLKLVDLVIQIT